MVREKLEGNMVYSCKSCSRQFSLKSDHLDWTHNEGYTIHGNIEHKYLAGMTDTCDCGNHIAIQLDVLLNEAGAVTDNDYHTMGADIVEKYSC